METMTERRGVPFLLWDVVLPAYGRRATPSAKTNSRCPPGFMRADSVPECLLLQRRLDGCERDAIQYELNFRDPSVLDRN